MTYEVGPHTRGVTATLHRGQCHSTGGSVPYYRGVNATAQGGQCHITGGRCDITRGITATLQGSLPHYHDGGSLSMTRRAVYARRIARHAIQRIWTLVSCGFNAIL